MRRPLSDKRPIGPFASLEGKYIIDVTEIGGDGTDRTEEEIADSEELGEPIEEFEGRVTSRISVTVPANIRSAHDIEPGDLITYRVTVLKNGKEELFTKSLNERNDLGLSEKPRGGFSSTANIEHKDRVKIEIFEVRKV